MIEGEPKPLLKPEEKPTPPMSYGTMADFYLDDEIHRQELEDDYNPWLDPEDLTTYLEPYQND